MRMNKARPTISGSLIKHRAYLTYIKYNKNVNNNIILIILVIIIIITIKRKAGRN